MRSLKILAAMAVLAIGGSALVQGVPTPAAAASPKCKPSTSPGHKWTCTTDYRANPSGGPTRRQQGTATVRIKQIKPKYKANPLPCWVPNGSGC